MTHRLPGDDPNVLLVGGPLHGARMRVEHLPMTMVLTPPSKRETARRTYVHQYEVTENNGRLVSVYAPPELSHPEVICLAKLASRRNVAKRP
jgi:hypothetical protein